MQDSSMCLHWVSLVSSCARGGLTCDSLNCLSLFLRSRRPEISVRFFWRCSYADASIACKHLFSPCHNFCKRRHLSRHLGIQHRWRNPHDEAWTRKYNLFFGQHALQKRFFAGLDAVHTSLMNILQLLSISSQLPVLKAWITCIKKKRRNLLFQWYIASDLDAHYTMKTTQVQSVPPL